MALMPRPLARGLFLAILPLAALPALTQNTPPPAPPAPLTPPTAKTSTRLLEVIHADNLSRSMRDGGQVVVLSGHVHLKEGDTHFYADRIVYNEAKKQGEAVRDPRLKGGSIGNPVVKDEFHTLTADRMTLDFSSSKPEQKVVSAIGNVRFVAKPKPQAGGASPAEAEKEKDRILPRRVREETVLTCNRLDYFYRRRRAVAEGDLKVVQGKRWLTGNQAIYYKQYETVVVNENVRGEDEKGRTFAADNMKVVLTGDTETIEANKFTGTFMLEDEETSPAAPGPELADDRPPVFPGSDEAQQEPPPAPASPSPGPAEGPAPSAPQ